MPSQTCGLVWLSKGQTPRPQGCGDERFMPQVSKATRQRLPPCVCSGSPMMDTRLSCIHTRDSCNACVSRGQKTWYRRCHGGITSSFPPTFPLLLSCLVCEFGFIYFTSFFRSLFSFSLCGWIKSGHKSYAELAKKKRAIPPFPLCPSCLFQEHKKMHHD